MILAAGLAGHQRRPVQLSYLTSISAAESAGQSLQIVMSILCPNLVEEMEVQYSTEIWYKTMDCRCGAQKINAAGGVVPIEFPMRNIKDIVQYGGDVDWKSVLRYIDPKQFLSMATPLYPSDDRTKRVGAMRDAFGKGVKFDPAYLRLEPNREGHLSVTGHEGRHRANAAIEGELIRFLVLFDVKHWGRVPDLSKEGKLGPILNSKYYNEETYLKDFYDTSYGRGGAQHFNFKPGGKILGKYANGLVPNFADFVVNPKRTYLYDRGTRNDPQRHIDARKKGYELLNADDLQEIKSNPSILGNTPLKLIDPTNDAQDQLGKRFAKQHFYLTQAANFKGDKFAETQLGGLQPSTLLGDIPRFDEISTLPRHQRKHAFRTLLDDTLVTKNYFVKVSIGATGEIMFIAAKI